LTSDFVLCRKSTDLSWEGDETSAAVAEEVSAPASEESAPLPQAETVTPIVEATLPEAIVVKGEYTTVIQPSSSSSQIPWGTDPMCLVLTGAEVEGSTIPEAVLVEGVVPETEVATGAATEPAETAAPGVAEVVRGDALPEPMSEAATTSRDGLELLADDLINPATVARNLESMRRTEQWMKVCNSTL
jgi:hypothetical protein